MGRASIRTYILALAISLLASLMPSVLATTESLRAGIDVWSYGWVEVDLPEGWTVTGNSTYKFHSARAEDFVLLITPLPQMKSMAPEDRCRIATLTAKDIQKGDVAHTTVLITHLQGLEPAGRSLGFRSRGPGRR